jgi:hypothetical protein
MSSFAYEVDQTFTPPRGEGDVQATHGFEAQMPMESNVEGDFTSFPWEATPDFIPQPSGGVFPLFAGGSVVTVLHVRVQEAAQEYVARIESQLPENVRESFVRGAGMFDFDTPDEDLDDLLT